MTADNTNRFNGANRIDDLGEMIRVFNQHRDLNFGTVGTRSRHGETGNARSLLGDRAGDLFQCRMNIRNVDIKLDMEALVILGIPLEIRPGFRIASQTSLNV